MRRLSLLLLICFSLLNIVPSESQTTTYIRADRLGITHISSATTETAESRYEQALLLGVGWNRWPLYWHIVEPEPTQWDWEAYDRQVGDDIEYGLKVNAILMGRPEFYAEGNRIKGLNEPIFTDGTDTPGPGKRFNPNNPWVMFVYQAVNRYKPNGLYARENRLPVGTGIRVWEIWNEPDHRTFWTAGVLEYARLLKVAYIVVKSTDPYAQVMFGGLLFSEESHFLTQVLSVYQDDPQRDRFNWYMDMVAVHSYNDPWRSGWLTLYTRESLKAFGLERPIWLNEMGVAVWDDYPGPVWDSTSTGRATTEQQAWYMIQSAAYAWAEGADKVFVHQLYDDCGDQPAGTDFPPHGGDLCTNGDLCYGDAHGLYRNKADSTCFSQHPFPGTPRPAAQAYRLLADVFGKANFENGTAEVIDSKFTVITFERPRTEERISVIWNRTTEPDTLIYPAVATSGTIHSLSGNHFALADDDLHYILDLEPALPDGDLSGSSYGGVAIGGPPIILVEKMQFAPEVLNPSGPVIVNPTQDAQNVIPVVPTSTVPPPTVAPENDVTPPTAIVNPLPEVSQEAFQVSWYGQDDGGIAGYIILVNINGEGWQSWIDTAETSATYLGIVGNTYEFAAWAVDMAGNWSTNIDPVAQAVTRVE